jgi:acetaldehyde dehydrogenase/alcohol dehydrogenase
MELERPVSCQRDTNDNPTKQTTFAQYDRLKAKCRYAEIAAHLGLSGDTSEEKVESLVARVESLNRRLGVPASIHDFGIPELEFFSKVDATDLDAFDDQCTGANPRFPLIHELRAMLVDTYYGRPFVELHARNVPVEHDSASAVVN